MTMISNYYTQVGVEIRRDSLRKVDQYLRQIRQRLQNFQRTVNRVGSFRVTARLDSTRTMARLQRDINNIGRNLRVSVNRVAISRDNLSRSIQQAFSGTQGAIQLNARVSQQSLDAMKEQVRNSLSNLTISPSVNAKVSRGTFGSSAVGAAAGAAAGARTGHRWAGDKTKRMSPTSGRRFNPWYNPMMVGGGLGAFLRYGVYSLPFVAGAMGFSALTDRAERIQSSYRLLDVATGSPMAGLEQMEFLQRLGSDLGFVGMDIAPQYARLLTAARGTSLERDMPTHFENFMRYAAVTGADTETITVLMRRILSRRRLRTGDFDQLEVAGLSNITQLVADAVTGGDTEALSEMLAGSGVDAEKILPQLFNQMGRESVKYLDQYYSTLERHRGRAAQASERWWQGFMKGGVEEALTDFYIMWAQIANESADSATNWGNFLSTIIHGFNSAVLSAVELWEYISKSPQEGNIWVEWFGDPDDNPVLTTFRNMMSAAESTTEHLKVIWENHGEDIKSILKGAFALYTETMRMLMELVETSTAFFAHGTGGILYTVGLQKARKEGEEAERAYKARYNPDGTLKDASVGAADPLTEALGESTGLEKASGIFAETMANSFGMTYLDRDSEGNWVWSRGLLPYFKGEDWGAEVAPESFASVVPDLNQIEAKKSAEERREYEAELLANSLLKVMELRSPTPVSDLNVLVTGSISVDGSLDVDGERIEITVEDVIGRTIGQAIQSSVGQTDQVQ